MAKIRTFRGSRDNIVRPLGLGQKIKAQEPDEAADETSVELDALAVAGVPDTIIADDPNGEIVEIIGEPLEQTEDGSPVDVESLPALSEEPSDAPKDDEPADSEGEDVKGEDEAPEPEPLPDLDAMSKPELQAFAESLGIDSSGRIDHLRSRIAKSLKEG